MANITTLEQRNMQKTLLIILPLMVLFTGQALAKNNNSNSGKRPPAPEFSTFDTNEDGIIELSEFTAVPHPHKDPTSVFEYMDSDDNGIVSAQEFSSHKPPRKKMKEKN